MGLTALAKEIGSKPESKPVKKRNPATPDLTDVSSSGGGGGDGMEATRMVVRKAEGWGKFLFLRVQGRSRGRRNHQ